MTNAERDIEHGCKFPFDAPDVWWERKTKNSPPATDWEHRATRGVIANLRGRCGIKNELEVFGLDEETRRDIVETIAEIIRTAKWKEIESRGSLGFD